MNEKWIADQSRVDPVTTLGGTLLPLNGELDSKKMRMVVGLFQPHEGLKVHLHERTEELYYAIEGECRVKIGDSVVDFTAGQAAKIPPGIPHGLYNGSQSPVRLLFVLAPTEQDMVVLADEVTPL